MSDLISRQALIEELGKNKYVDWWFVRGLIESAPPVEPVRHGRWVTENGEPPKCSRCGIEALEHTIGIVYVGQTVRIESKYCPNCGAKMNEVTE